MEHTTKYMNVRRTLVGAWIETPSLPLALPQNKVAPLWVRGLKLKKSVKEIYSLPVAPLWVRGLKPPGEAHHQCCPRRTLVGAWIETGGILKIDEEGNCRTLVGAWIETRETMVEFSCIWSHPCGCVD